MADIKPLAVWKIEAHNSLDQIDRSQRFINKLPLVDNEFFPAKRCVLSLKRCIKTPHRLFDLGPPDIVLQSQLRVADLLQGFGNKFLLFILKS